jgi:hypothetical protein
VDVGGLGAGVVDRLKELQFNCVEAVNAGEKALEPNRFLTAFGSLPFRNGLHFQEVFVPESVNETNRRQHACHIFDHCH